VAWVVVLRKPLAAESLVIAGDQKTAEKRYLSIHLPLYSVQQLGHSPGGSSQNFPPGDGHFTLLCRRSHTDTWAFLPQRDLRGEDSRDKGQKTSQGSWQYCFEDWIWICGAESYQYTQALVVAAFSIYWHTNHYSATRTLHNVSLWAYVSCAIHLSYALDKNLSWKHRYRWS